jgi:multicomponent Na+:H+ antiporter subunit G
MMLDWLAAVSIGVGVIFSVLAAVGILRMPDFYMRLQATTKSATLGVACLAIAAGMSFDDAAVTTKAVLVIAFLFLTAPVAAHVIGRAAYATGVPMWERTLFDEMAGMVEHPPLPDENQTETADDPEPRSP